MNIYFHHVGLQGSAKDFPRTVVRPSGELVYWALEDLTDPLSDLSEFALEALRRDVGLSERKSFQIWGVPSGGEQALSKLDLGDYFLLLPSDRLGSAFRYGGKVIARVPRLAHRMSEFLWASNRYPLVFFLSGSAIEYSFDQFKTELGYRANWTLRGKAFRVMQERIERSRFKSSYDLIREIMSTDPNGARPV